MAWNPTPEVAMARDYANKFKQTKVIILAIDEKAEKYGVISYGENKQKCNEAKAIANAIYELVADESIPI